MNQQVMSDGRTMIEDISDFEPEFNEIEIGRLTEAEYEAANLRHELFLVRERQEMEIFERELDEELSQLFRLSGADEVGREQPNSSG
jgi:hypothetical protein